VSFRNIGPVWSGWMGLFLLYSTVKKRRFFLPVPLKVYIKYEKLLISDRHRRYPDYMSLKEKCAY
jgi:hypothetical protein